MKRLMDSKNKIIALVLSMVMIFTNVLCFQMVNVNAQGKSYVALGDSISTGYGLVDPTNECFVNILTAQSGYTLTNYAVNGNTTAGLMKQTDKTNPLLDTAVLGAADVITISIGGNDAMNVLYQGVADAMKITIEQAKEKLFSGDFTALFSALNVIKLMSENPGATIPFIMSGLEASIDNIRHYNKTAQIVLLTQYNPYLWIKEPMFANAIKQMNTYLAALKDAFCNSAFKDDVIFADAFTHFENKKDGESLANASGSPINLDFHPNKLGHSEIATLVGEALLKPFINEKTITNGIVGKAFSVKLTSRGADPIDWSISDGSLPSGLSLDSQTGEISGTPTAVGESTFTVMAKNTYGTQMVEYTINITQVQERPQIIREDIPPCTIDVPYSYTFKATGTTPITWSIMGPIPSGLTFNSDTGELSGIPDSSNMSDKSEPNQAVFLITAENSVGESDMTPVSICIAERAGAPTILPQHINEGTVGVSYGYQILATATGGLNDEWSLEDGTSLPAGLTLDPKTGFISGTPTESGIFTVKIRFSNGFGKYFRNMNIEVVKLPDPAVITTTSLDDAIKGTPYSQTLKANGDAPITWAVESGELPNGVALNSQTGEISGTPTVSGTFKIKIKATNLYGSDAKDFSITVISVPTYTVTIPDKIEFGSISKVVESDTANRFAKSAEVSVGVSYANLFENKKALSITVGGDFNLICGAEKLPFTLHSGNTEFFNNSMIFEIIPTASNPDDTLKSESKNLFAKLDQSKINQAGSYTGSIIFTVELKEAK